MAPEVEKSEKFAVVPRVGACASVVDANAHIAIPVSIEGNLFIIKLD
jgi:hypothetical protein